MKAATVRRTHTAPLPAHPLLMRWVWGCINLFLVELAFCAPLAGRGLLRLMPDLALAVTPYERWLPWVDWALWAVGMVILLATWIQLALVLVLLWCWGRTLRRMMGTYHAVILPKPTGRVSHVAPTAQAAPLWERIVAAIEHAPAPAYLATELWGDASGRVGWGVWLPDALHAERPTLQRLITAERPQARLATAPDPLAQSLEAEGAAWYAGATLELAAFDHYPLKADPLALPTLAAALRPQGGVIACGVSLIVRPTPRSWSRAVRIKAQRRVAKVRRLGDRQQTALAEVIQTKAVQPAARTLIRVHVVAATQALAEAERGTLIQTLMANEGRYTQYLTQRWRVTERIVVEVGAKRVPRQWCVRAPRCPLPLLWPLVPLV